MSGIQLSGRSLIAALGYREHKLRWNILVCCCQSVEIFSSCLSSLSEIVEIIKKKKKDCREMKLIVTFLELQPLREGVHDFFWGFLHIANKFFRSPSFLFQSLFMLLEGVVDLLF